MAPTIEIFPDLDSLSLAAGERFIQAARDAVALRNRFCVALSGGSTPKRLYHLLAENAFSCRIPWERVHLFWGDERFVPADHPESNYRMIREALIDRVPIPAENVHAMPVEEGNIEAAAQEHCRQLDEFFGTDIQLDLALMGMGPDGHTASLFPGDPALQVEDRSVAVARPASQPTERLTMTTPVFNRTRQVIFLVAGADKAAVLAKVIAKDPTYPSAHIQPEGGQLIWLLDQAAAAQLRA